MPRWKQVSRIFLKESNIIIFQETRPYSLQILLIQRLIDDSKLHVLFHWIFLDVLWKEIFLEMIKRKYLNESALNPGRKKASLKRNRL